MSSTLRERDQNLINSWYIACLSRELKNGKILKRQIYDRTYVLFRGPDGKPSCLPNRCLHRAAQLAEGKLCQGNLVCPYHGWAYNPRGELVEIPSVNCNQKVSGRLRALPCFEKEGVIWIWPGEGSPSPETPPWSFPYSDDPSWTKYFMITDFENEVTHLVENFMDVPHTVFVHSKWFRTRKNQNVPVTLEVNKGKVLVTYHQEKDSIGFTSRILNPKGHRMIHTDCFIYPNLTRVDYQFGENRGFVINSQCTPESTLKTRVYTYIAYQLGPGARLLKPFFQFYTRRVIQQDVWIMKNQGDNFKEDFSQKFMSTEIDDMHLAIETLRKKGAQRDPELLDFEMKRKAEFWI